ncbi:Divalent cation transporting (P-type) ATPase [Bradyrhizobium sp. STM 3809]|nr:Divalent cation transporting (P-type) ATPase [Bradyrhizobium sp. STM 3809]
MHEYVEASVIGALLVFNAGLGLFHERRAKSTLAALKSRLALNASVLRDGNWITLPAAGLVPGDIAKLTLGGVVPADARLVEGAVLLDQAMLTGESMPIEAGPGFEALSGALVKRGEAVVEIIATGSATRFGRTADLVRTAHVTSTQQKAVLRVVLNLAGINGAIALTLIAYAWHIGLPIAETVPLALIAILASVPVALPATFTLANSIGAQELGKLGVLPTRLSAVDEAASMNVLCVDKTGTLTSSDLKVAVIAPIGGRSEAEVMMWARLASADGGLDPVDAAVRLAERRPPTADAPTLEKFIPFDPTTKTAEAFVHHRGQAKRVVKGAFAYVMATAKTSDQAVVEAERLEKEGYRVLAVAVGPPSALEIVGLLALSDPPRPEAASCIAKLKSMGVHVLMITGDAPATAAAVARDVGLNGPVATAAQITETMQPDEFAVFAGVLPEHKYKLVKALQRAGYTVGMCGDGANDAPALSQAHLGIAVSTATDVAKFAAGLVLTEPGLAGIVDAIAAGRVAFQRILTYTLRSIIHKVRQVTYLGVGLLITDHAILTPMLVVISMITGDFLAMSSTTDNVRPSEKPNSWKVGNLTLAGVALGLVDLGFCIGVLLIGKDLLHLGIDALRTLTMVNLVCSGHAIYYAVRERRRIWSSRPSKIVIFSSFADLLIVPTMAYAGILMTPLSPHVIFGVFSAALIFAFFLDEIKTQIFRVLDMD